MGDLFDAPLVIPKNQQRCKRCAFYKGDVAGRYAAGDCQETRSPRVVTTPEATCDQWTVRK